LRSYLNKHKFAIVDYKMDLISKLLSKKSTRLVTSINDLRDKEFSGIKLTSEERFALNNFDKYRINLLNSQEDEEKFHQHYRQLQVIANLTDWREFLKDSFSK